MGNERAGAISVGGGDGRGGRSGDESPAGQFEPTRRHEEAASARVLHRPLLQRPVREYVVHLSDDLYGEGAQDAELSRRLLDACWAGKRCPEHSPDRPSK